MIINQILFTTQENKGEQQVVLRLKQFLNLQNSATTKIITQQETLCLQSTKFKNGMSIEGGAIYIAGDSNANIQSSIFQNNKARSKGDNYAGDLGDDIYLTSSLNLITLKQVQITNLKAKNSIYIEQAKIYSQELVIKDANQNENSYRGAGIYCYYCRGLEIRDSSFINLRSVYGGAIYILEQDLGKETSNKNNKKFQIINSTFTNCTGEQGGALMLDNAQSVFIQNSKFIGNTAKVIPEYQIHAADLASGGAIYYSCNAEILNCILIFDGVNIFKHNNAYIKGGAIYWTILEPIFDSNNLNFIDNSAFQYGDNLACFPQKLGSLSVNQYLAHILKLGLIENTNQRLLQYTTAEKIQYFQSIQSQKSGGAIPIIYMALIDQYGQIVGSDSNSKVRISIQANNLDEKAIMYPAILQGNSDFQASSGIAIIQDVIVTGTPGNIHLRECIEGEQFTSAGKCIECQDNTYSLIKMIEPSSCEICPTEKAICIGGANIGPLPGYWRKSNTTKRIEKCLFEPACLGMIPPNQNPMGDCLQGYRGILCTDCSKGYSRDNDYQSSAYDIFIQFFMV
ncbi:UNKNOWN [Stylonychia lemnae]|uniref:Uncharacterized protein n=1 Tax=Stylonychia lemnae TaxID=5949 RepID=A0A078AUB2_STYLE|nr:UNKNOWN [Stylonychia lemnae]|eukprot:CDW85824.1 UNKNOWN [Stylonychia lemnae]